MSSKGKKKSGAKPMSKTDLVRELADRTGLEKKNVAAVFEALEAVTAKELKSKGVAAPLPGMVKIVVKHKKATPAREGRNPRTGEAMTISAKPAHKTVRARVLKKLKDVVVG